MGWAAPKLGFEFPELKTKGPVEKGDVKLAIRGLDVVVVLELLVFGGDWPLGPVETFVGAGVSLSDFPIAAWTKRKIIYGNRMGNHRGDTGCPGRPGCLFHIRPAMLHGFGVKRNWWPRQITDQDWQVIQFACADAKCTMLAKYTSRSKRILYYVYMTWHVML